MSANQVGYFYEPAERGRLCVIRFMAPHYTGGGEVVARNVELELAKTMCVALNSYASSQAEIERLRNIVSQCADALGNGAYIAPSASLEFMEKLPGEIQSVVAALSGSKE